MKPLAIAFAALLVVGSAAAAEGACPHPFSNGELEKFDAFKEKLGEAKELVERSQELAGYLGGEEVELPEVLGAAFEVFDKYEDLEKTAKKPFEYGVKAIRIGMAIDCLREVKALPPTDPSARLGLIIGLGDLMAVAGDTLEAHDPFVLLRPSAMLLREARGIFDRVHGVSGVCRNSREMCEEICSETSVPASERGWACEALRPAQPPGACSALDECLGQLVGTEESGSAIAQGGISTADVAALQAESKALVYFALRGCATRDCGAQVTEILGPALPAIEAFGVAMGTGDAHRREVASCVAIARLERASRRIPAPPPDGLFRVQEKIDDIQFCPQFGRITGVYRHRR
jgi:hypothetical protein